MTSLTERMRKLSTASANGTLKKELKIGTFILTGWLGDSNPKEPRVRMETMQVEAKGLMAAKQKYMRQWGNRLPPEALNLETRLVIIRVDTNEEPQTFPADTVPTDGVVKFWKDNEGTGYITAEGKDYFVHHSEIAGDEEIFPTLQTGQQVKFIPSTRKGMAVACAVAAVEE